MNGRRGVFISHLAEEAPVALVLKEALQAAFGDDFPVFVSTDKASIKPGRQWYNTIVNGLLCSKVVIILLSQESNRRPWLNFEAGMGVGGGIDVIPLTLTRFASSQAVFPIAGMQIYSIDDIGIVLNHISSATGLLPSVINNDAYIENIRRAEAALNYKSLVVTPVVEGQQLWFDIENVGNADLELLMLEITIPRAATVRAWAPSQGVGFDSWVRVIDGKEHLWIALYSPRGSYTEIPPLLRPILTPTMGKFRPRYPIALADGYPIELGGLAMIEFQLHAVGYSTQRDRFELTQFRLPKS
jgi:hypothetical protein